MFGEGNIKGSALIFIIVLLVVSIALGKKPVNYFYKKVKMERFCEVCTVRIGKLIRDESDRRLIEFTVDEKKYSAISFMVFPNSISSDSTGASYIYNQLNPDKNFLLLPEESESRTHDLSISIGLFFLAGFILLILIMNN